MHTDGLPVPGRPAGLRWNLLPTNALLQRQVHQPQQQHFALRRMQPALSRRRDMRERTVRLPDWATTLWRPVYGWALLSERPMPSKRDRLLPGGLLGLHDCSSGPVLVHLENGASEHALGQLR
jgi:hypothetical protein